MYVFVAYSVGSQGQTQSLSFFFQVSNLRPIFEKAYFDVADKECVEFRKIKSAVICPQNCLFV